MLAPHKVSCLCSFIHINLSEGPNRSWNIRTKIISAKPQGTRHVNIQLFYFFFLKVKKVELGERDMLIEVLKKWFSRSQKNLQFLFSGSKHPRCAGPTELHSLKFKRGIAWLLLFEEWNKKKQHLRSLERTFRIYSFFLLKKKICIF